MNFMDLELTNDQELLRDTSARFIRTHHPLAEVRELASSLDGVPSGYLRDGANLGWFAMLVPEALGGGSVSGEGLRDLAIIAEERGRGLQPGPFVPMNVVASALAARGSEAQHEILAEIVAGEAVATWVAAERAGDWLPGRAVRAAATGDGFVLCGGADVVQDAALADWFLVTAGGADGLSQFLIPASAPGIAVLPRDGHDVTQRFASVSFDNVVMPATALLGPAGAAADDVERQLQVAIVLSVAEAVGTMDTLFEMARAYAVDRIAFGRPIGSFQAVKHQLADMSLSVEASKAIAAAATRAVQVESFDSGVTASMAKTWVADASIDVAQGCFQVFGGIGFTWEHDSHLFLRRLTMNSLLFGQPDWHRERICALSGV